MNFEKTVQTLGQTFNPRQETIQPIPILTNLASIGASFVFANSVGYPLYINQFSIAGNGGVPTVNLTINKVPWTNTPSGSGANFGLNPSNFSLVNIFTYSAQYQDQEIPLFNAYSINLNFVSGTGSVDVYFMIFNRIPISASAGL